MNRGEEGPISPNRFPNDPHLVLCGVVEGSMCGRCVVVSRWWVQIRRKIREIDFSRIWAYYHVETSMALSVALAKSKNCVED